MMKVLIRATLAFGLLVVSVGSADACCLWPFGSWWGAGYSGAPAYGYYGAGYPSWPSPVYTAGYYSAAYAPTADCCVPSWCNSCCNSCCDSCGGGGCATGSCGGVSNTGGGALKPANDPNFQNGTPKSDDDKDLDKDPIRPQADDPVDFDTPIRPRPSQPNPDDDFRASPMGGTGTGSDIPFELDGDRINNKPPMPDPGNLPAVEPDAGSTFLDEENTSDKQTRRKSLRRSLAERSSSLSEVITPGRLASRSLPSPGTQQATSWAGKSAIDKTQTDSPVRWISVPKPDGQVRL